MAITAYAKDFLYNTSIPLLLRFQVYGGRFRALNSASLLNHGAVQHTLISDFFPPQAWPPHLLQFQEPKLLLRY